MIVSELLDSGERQRTNIPEGAFAVVVDEVVDTSEPDDPETGYRYRSDDVGAYFLGAQPARVILRESAHHDHLSRHVLYWSEEPFVAVERWESPMDGNWARLACEVRANGLSKRLPIHSEPPYVSSNAGEIRAGDRTGKWANLLALASHLDVSPTTLIREYGQFHEGIERGVRYILASDEAAVASAETFQNAWDNVAIQTLCDTEPSHVWVSRRFVLVACYLRLVGYQPS